MKKISLIILFLVNSAMVIACDGSFITLTSGPTAIGGGQYSVTFNMCTSAGFCVNGNTGNFYFAVNGTTIDYAASTGSITSPHTAAVYGQVPIGPALGYTDIVGFTNAAIWYAVFNPFNPCVTLCVSVTLIFNGYPTDLTVLALEGADSPAAGCAGETIIFPVLPIELLSFEANCNDGDVKIDWITQSEINNDYFTIERSSDGINFNEIFTIKGAGNSSIIKSYSIIDEQPLIGVYYYRLKQTDFDGAYEYFNPVAVNNCYKVDDLNLFPNPATSDLNLSITSNNENTGIHVAIYDITGAIVLERNIDLIKGLNQVSLNINDLSKGMYFITVENEGATNKIKFIKK